MRNCSSDMWAPVSDSGISSSFPRKRESSVVSRPRLQCRWVPAFAGKTTKTTHHRASFFLHRRQVGAHAFEYLGRHANGFAQGRMRMNRLADVSGIAAHLHREAHFADEIAGVRADDASANA